MAPTNPVNWPTSWPMTVDSLPVEKPEALLAEAEIGKSELRTCAAQSLPGLSEDQLTAQGLAVCASAGTASAVRTAMSRQRDAVCMTASGVWPEAVTACCERRRSGRG